MASKQFKVIGTKLMAIVTYEEETRQATYSVYPVFYSLDAEAYYAPLLEIPLYCNSLSGSLELIKKLMIKWVEYAYTVKTDLDNDVELLYWQDVQIATIMLDAYDYYNIITYGNCGHHCYYGLSAYDENSCCYDNTDYNYDCEDKKCPCYYIKDKSKIHKHRRRI